MKICSVCKIEKPLEDFYNSQSSKDGKSYRCIACDKAARATYKERNREKFLQTAREVNWRMRFGMEPEDYDRMFEEQNGQCAICGSENPNGATSKSTKTRNFSVDHCHETGKIRGLLCTSCNRGLGLLGDTVASLRAALEYLEST